MSDVTQILHQIESGDPSAAEQLLPLVYEELRKLAGVKMAQESPGHTLQATALVHEAYVRLVETDLHQQWDSRGHFFVAAAEAMRRILVESARRRLTLKRGGDRNRVDAEIPDVQSGLGLDDIVTLDEVLKRLAGKDGRKARLVELRYFAGLTIEEAARVLDVSVSTAERDWAFARAWLRREMLGENER